MDTVSQFEIVPVKLLLDKLMEVSLFSFTMTKERNEIIENENH